MKEIIDYLESEGYRRGDTLGGFQEADFYYGKKFRDGRGIKYSIQFVRYSLSYQGVMHYSWMAHLNNNEPHQTYEQHHLQTLEEIKKSEENIEKFWEMFGSYYSLDE